MRTHTFCLGNEKFVGLEWYSFFMALSVIVSNISNVLSLLLVSNAIIFLHSYRNDEM